MASAYTISMPAPVGDIAAVRYREYLELSSLRTLEGVKIWKVTMEEEPSLKITLKEPEDGAEEKVDYPKEIPSGSSLLAKINLLTEEITAPSLISVKGEEYEKIKPVVKKLIETVSNLNFEKTTIIMKCEKRLNEILENVSEKRFNLGNAEDFIRYKPAIERLPADSPLREVYQNIRNIYRLDFLLPILEGWERAAILNHLNKKSLESKNELKKVIRNEVNIQSDWLFNYHFKRAIEDLLYFGFITKEKVGILGKTFYRITEKGKIATMLIEEYKDSIPM